MNVSPPCSLQGAKPVTLPTLDVDARYWAINKAGGYLFTIIKREGDLPKFSRVSVYVDNENFGVYQVLETHTFKLKNLSNLASLLVLGEHKAYGVKTIQELSFNQGLSLESDMYLIGLRFLSKG